MGRLVTSVPGTGRTSFKRLLWEENWALKLTLEWSKKSEASRFVEMLLFDFNDLSRTRAP